MKYAYNDWTGNFSREKETLQKEQWQFILLQWKVLNGPKNRLEIKNEMPRNLKTEH
jgi:hypothetical protein